MFCFGLLQTHASKMSASWISLTFLCTMVCMWTSVDCWSYYYSNKTMNWEQARDWCKTHYTDMVAIQNQEEIAYLNDWLPKKPTYYWIGIRKINDVWTWVGTNKPLTDEASNWAKDEPNNGKTTQTTGNNEDCVEMYIKRREQTGKWNDERCGKPKTALCYSAACKNDSCLYGDCVETINSHRCECYEGFYGEKCDQIVKCNKDEVTVPDKGSVNCTHTYGDFFYDSLCQYSCEEGYNLSMTRPLRCTASEAWSDQPPTCELVQCPGLSHPDRGSMTCSDPLGLSSFQSTCVFTCDEGYVHSGSSSDVLQCEATGNWNASQPSCNPVQCSSLTELENGFINCGDDANTKFTYENTCTFSCAPGYKLVGSETVTCMSSAEWSESMPHCEAITCQTPEKEDHLIVQCSGLESDLRPESTCSFSCEAGFELQGEHTIQCSGNGEWNEVAPTCKAITCQIPEKGDHLIIQCSGLESDLRPESTCSFSCEAGFELQGEQTIQCSGNGEWNEAAPTCKAISCPAPEISPRGVVSCTPSPSSPPSADTQYPLGTVCTFSCDEGHELQGDLSMECAHPGQWTSTSPTCTAVRCPLLEAPENGHINCSASESVYNSQCSFTCDQGYSLEGLERLTCDHHGNWTAEKPTCKEAEPPSEITAIASGVTVGGAVSLSGLSLAMWLLKRLRQKVSKFELNSNSDIEAPPQVYKNSTENLL